jgi:hypothetical protein
VSAKVGSSFCLSDIPLRYLYVKRVGACIATCLNRILVQIG